MSEPTVEQEQELSEGLDFSDALKQAKPDPQIPSKPSELVAEALEVEMAREGRGPSVLYPFMHGLLCGLKLGGL